MWSRQGEEASKNESHVHRHKKRRAAPFGSSPSIVEPRSLWTASSVASRRCPRKRQASRSCEPATAAEDNETLDHLLSFVAVMRAIDEGNVSMIRIDGRSASRSKTEESPAISGR